MLSDREIVALFLPHTINSRDRLEGGGRLVHYTSAEAGFQILKNKQIWMRNCIAMNDYSEILHGFACVQRGWHTPKGEAFKHWLEACRPGMYDQLVHQHGMAEPGIRLQTFVMSLSAHLDSEDAFGRLSMWRAYGRPSGVALVLNPSIFLSETTELGVFSAPVLYMAIDQFETFLDEWFERIMAAEEQLADMLDATLLRVLMLAIRIFGLCTKHPAFAEEQEWRIFHSPMIEAKSKWVHYTEEIIRSVPQQVVKIDLEDDPDSGVIGLSPEGLINRVIIGPCDYPLSIEHAFGAAMNNAGVSDALAKVYQSKIPLRHQS